MRTLIKLLPLVLLFAPVAFAQGPVFAGVAPSYEAGIGYAYVDAGVPSETRLAMNGIDLLGTADFNRRFGIHLDLGYARNFNAFSSNHTADLLTYMAGPVFYPLRKRNFTVYTHVLFGGARETGVNFEPDGQIVTGFVNRFAWDAGVGVQYRMSRSFSVRVGADYLHTTFFNSNIELAGQSNLKPSVSLIYTFGEGRER